MGRVFNDILFWYILFLYYYYLLSVDEIGTMDNDNGFYKLLADVIVFIYCRLFFYLFVYCEVS